MSNIKGRSGQREERRDVPYSLQQRSNTALTSTKKVPLIRTQSAPPDLYVAPEVVIDFNDFNDFEDIVNSTNILTIKEPQPQQQPQPQHPMYAEETKEQTQMEQEYPPIEADLQMPEMVKQMNIINTIIEGVTDTDIEAVEDKIDDKQTKEDKTLMRKGALFETLKNKFKAFINKIYPLHTFSQLPTNTSIAVVFITKHGGYDVEKDKKTNRFTIETVPCPVKNLIRLQLAPHGTCSWANPESNFRDFSYIYCKLTNASIPQFHKFKEPQQPLIPVNDDMLKLIINELEKSATILTSMEQCITDYHTEQGKPLSVGEKRISKKLQCAGKVRGNKLGDLLINKEYQLDLSGDTTSGILIMFNVTFKLPDIFFIDDNTTPVDLFTALLTQINSSPITAYKIGRYNRADNTITYDAMTELMSCPFFQLYVTLFENISKPQENGMNNFAGIIKNDGISFDNSFYTRQYDGMVTNIDCSLIDSFSYPQITLSSEKRPMLFEVNTKILYSYFQYCNTFVNVDLSCGSFAFPDNPTNITDVNDITAMNRFFTTIQRRGKQKGIYGGKNNAKKTKKKIKKHTNKLNKKRNNKKSKCSKKCNKHK
jgi:hypothetical protein